MSEMKLAIIGAGPGGYSAAVRAARLGAKVTLIDKGKPGGTCLNWGCIPSKIMRRSADAAREAKNAGLFGIESTVVPGIRMDVLRKRQKGIVDGQSAGLSALFKMLGIQWVEGSARAEKPGLLLISKPDGSSEDLHYDHLLIACGSAPSSIPALPIDGKKILSSDHALWMEDLPRSLLVVGGGVIGCELAQIFHDFGVQVTLLEGLDRLLPLPSLDEEISKNYMRCLKKNRLPFHVGQTLAEVKETPQGLRAVIKPFSGDGESKELEFEKILVSIGRRSVTQELGLEKLGVKLDARGWIETDDFFRTAAERVWAIGDCLGPTKIMLAHVATAEGLAAVENMFGGQRTVKYAATPSAVFTAPEIGSVGLTLAQAQERDPGSSAHDFLFRQLGKAQAMGEIDGLTRLVVGSQKEVLGGHIIGPSATSLIAEIALAVSKGLTAEDLASTVHAHPTLPEGIWEAALGAVGRPLHGA